MSTPQTEPQIDINQLIQEVGQEVDALIKAEKEKLEALNKAEPVVKQEEKKEESSKEDSKDKSDMEKMEAVKKDDEGSGFESPAPEASAQSAAPDMSAQAPQEQSAESLESMVQGLSEEELQELMQVVQMEMQSRQAQQAPAESQAAPEASAPAAAPEMKAEMAYKKELDEVRGQLKKSEDQSKKVEEAFTVMVDLMDKVVNRPVQKAITDIRTIDYADKGEKDLKKSEVVDISDSDLEKRLRKMSSDRKELGALNKSEREALSDYFVTKKRTPEVLKLISK